MSNTFSIRRALGINLALALLPMLLLANAGAYWLAKSAVADTYDTGLLDDARDIETILKYDNDRLSTDIGQSLRQALLRNDYDHLLYAIWSARGESSIGDARLQKLADARNLPTSGHHFFNSRIGAEIYRVVVLPATRDGSSLQIAVATTTHGLQKIMTGVMEGMALLDILLVSAVLWGLHIGIRRGLRPLDNLSTAIASRSAMNMQPVDKSASPAELRPVVSSVNSLLRSLELAINRHRHFIADAAHQLRTPLAVMRSRLDVARLNAATESPLVNDLLYSVDELSHLTQQLVSLARLDQLLLQEPEHIPCDIPALIQRVTTRYWQLAAKKNVEFDFALSALSISGTPLLLEEMFANLFDNAIRYSAPGNTINISLRDEDGTAIFEIRDQGPGVAPAALAKLGTRFFREQDTSSTNEGGCGLGLAIVHEIVKLHRGTLNFANRSDGPGFVVTITLPCV